MAMTPEEMRRLQARLNAIEKKQQTIAQRTQERMEKELKGMIDLLGTEEKRAELAARRLQEEQKIPEAYETELARVEAIEGASSQRAQALEATIQNLQSQLQITERLVENTDTVRKSSELTKEYAENLAGEMFGINKRTEDLGKVLMKNGKIYSNTFRLTKNTVTLLSKQLSVTNLVGRAASRLAEKMKAGAKAAQNYVNQFSVFAGPLDEAKKFEDRMIMLSRDVGITSRSMMESVFGDEGRMGQIAANSRFATEQVQKGYVTLFKSSEAFRTTNEETQDSINLTALSLERKYNVALGDTGAALNNLTQISHKTRKESESLIAQIVVGAQKLKMDPTKALSDYNATIASLAKFGLPSTTAEFGKLRNIQEQTGLSMNSLMSSMEKFSTFEGALNAASKLNTVFGTTVDGIELMETMELEGPTAAFLKIRKALDGVDFDKLGFSQRRALAESLGMSVADVAKAWSKPMADLQAIAADGEKQFMSVGDALSDVTGEAPEMETEIEKLVKAMDSMRKTIQPMVDFMVNLRKSFTDFVDKNPFMGWLISMGAPILALVGSIKLLSLGLTGLGTTAGIFAGAAGTGGKLGALAKGFGLLAKSAGAATIAMGGAFATKFARENMGGMGTTGGKLTNVAGRAATGAMAGAMFGPKGALIGGLAGGALGGIEALTGTALFAPGNNFVSQPTMGILGDAGAPETISPRIAGTAGRELAFLNAGDRIETTGNKTSRDYLNLTVNLVSPDGIVTTGQAKQIALGAAESWIEENLNMALT